MRLNMRKILIYLIALIGTLTSIEAGESNKPDISTYIENANSLAQQGNYKEAYIQINEALKINPSSPRANRIRGNLNFIRKNYKAALKDFSKVIEAYPKKSRAYSDRALVYYALENYEKAKEDAAQALHYNPKNIIAEKILGTIQ